MLIFSRPPIVAVLGHVDHGKTTLLDSIRKTNVVAREHGGITQHIGAYQVDYKGEKITFIDTPGHAAFSKMRSRGAQVTDLVVLVIAADDGIKPQTKESLAHIKQVNVPFLVAINKTDLPQASTDMVKSQLAENNVLVEDYGGDIVCVEVSAKQQKGIDDLLEMIILLSKMGDLKANPFGVFDGVVIDSKLDSQKGPLATVLVKNGTLEIGDKIFADDCMGSVKLMVDEFGKKANKAEPSKPIEVLGFKAVPSVGAKVEKKQRFNSDEKIINQKVELKTDDLEENKQSEDGVKIILKTDTVGSLEAIKANLPKEVVIISAETGQINESDILLAQSTKADILGFNVKSSELVKKLSQTEKINIKTYNTTP